jgi:hypothetical protein
VSLSAEVEREALERQLDAACAELGDNEIRVVLLIAKRLVMGRKAYGALDIHGDRRDGRHEASEEALDCAVYLAAETMRWDESGLAVSARKEEASGVTDLSYSPFKISRFQDYVVLRLGFSESADPAELGETIEEVLLPITTSTTIAVGLFDAVIRSTADLTAFFAPIQKPMADLNILSAEIEKKKAAIASGTTTEATKRSET